MVQGKPNVPDGRHRTKIKQEEKIKC